MSWLIFLVASLAVYRTADVLASEEGPAAIFSKLRRKVPARTNAGRGVRCPFCLGIWLSFIATAWLWWSGSVPASFTALYAFGLAGAAAVWKRLAE